MHFHFPYSFKKQEKNVIFVMFLLFSVACTGCSRQKREAFTQVVYTENEAESTAAQSGTENAKTADGEKESASAIQICVFVCGAVVNEGVYYLPEGSRVIDAVNAAGGYRDDADRSYINQAEHVHDAERVNIPTLEEAQKKREEDEAEQKETSRESSRASDGLININKASKTELMSIPGIGESKAERIIAYRESHGSFGSVEEIRNVSGIGNGIYEGLKDYITVE